MSGTHSWNFEPVEKGKSFPNAQMVLVQVSELYVIYPGCILKESSEFYRIPKGKSLEPETDGGRK